MTKRFREAFPRRAPKAPAPDPWMLTRRNAEFVLRIAASVKRHPNEILNQLVASAVMASQTLHIQLAYGGILMAAAQQASEPESPAPKVDEPVDERSTEEKLAELKDIAEGKEQRGEHAICQRCIDTISDEELRPTFPAMVNFQEGRILECCWCAGMYDKGVFREVTVTKPQRAIARCYGHAPFETMASSPAHGTVEAETERRGEPVEVSQ
jgi:hypothetical protein